MQLAKKRISGDKTHCVQFSLLGTPSASTLAKANSTMIQLSAEDRGTCAGQQFCAIYGTKRTRLESPPCDAFADDNLAGDALGQT